MRSMLCTALRVRSRAFQTIRCCPLPESFSLILDKKGLYSWFCRRSCWRACRAGWFSIFLNHFSNACTLRMLHKKCGNPGIRKSMFTSCTTVCWWLESSWLTRGLPVLSWNVSSPTLKVSLSWQERVWQLSGTLITSCVMTDLPLRSRIWFGIGWFDWNFYMTAQLLIVENVLNLLFSIHVSKRFLAGMEVACVLFRVGLLQFPSWQLSEYNKLVVFLGGWLHSSESDRMSILS